MHVSDLKSSLSHVRFVVGMITISLVAASVSLPPLIDPTVRFEPLGVWPAVAFVAGVAASRPDTTHATRTTVAASKPAASKSAGASTRPSASRGRVGFHAKHRATRAVPRRSARDSALSIPATATIRIRS